MSLQKITSSRPFKGMAAFLFCSMLMVSCHQVFEPQEKVILQNPHEWVGLMHNEGLDYDIQHIASNKTFDEIQAIVRANANNPNVRDSLLIHHAITKNFQLTGEYLAKDIKKKTGKDIDLSPLMNNYQGEMQRALHKITFNSYSYEAIKKNSLSFLKNDCKTISPKVKVYIDEVFTVIFETADNNQSPETALAKIGEIEQRILRETSSQDADGAIAQSFVSLVKHSGEYHLQALSNSKNGGTLTGVCSYYRANSWWIDWTLDALGFCILLAVGPAVLASSALAVALMDVFGAFAVQIITSLVGGIGSSAFINWTILALCNLIEHIQQQG